MRTLLKCLLLALVAANVLLLYAWQSLPIGGPAPGLAHASPVMYNVDGKPVARYHLASARPAKVVAEYDASKNEVSVESL